MVLFSYVGTFSHFVTICFRFISFFLAARYASSQDREGTIGAWQTGGTFFSHKEIVRCMSFEVSLNFFYMFSYHRLSRASLLLMTRRSAWWFLLP